MISGGRWFRLNTTWSQSEWIAALSPAARLAWVELLGHVKAHGYDGRLKEVTRYTVSRMYNIPADDVGAMMDAAQTHGAMVIEAGELRITKWREYQGDPTGAARVKRLRERNAEKREDTHVTRYNRVVTPTETETETIKKDPSGPKKRKLSSLPEDWSPTEEHARLALERGIDLTLEVDKMRDWATANDERKASWDATFRNWIRNAKPGTNGTNGHSGKPSSWENQTPIFVPD